MRQGFDQSRDFRVVLHTAIPNLSLPDLNVQLVWKHTHDAQKRVTFAQTEVSFAGFGWTKLESGGPDFQGKVEVRDGHIILFECYHTLAVPAIPITELVEKLGAVNRWPFVIKGWFDTQTESCRAEMHWR